MKILILGGTGAIGISLVQILAKQGNEVYVTSRSSHADEGNIHYIQGNAMEDSFLRKIVRGEFDAIVDLMSYQMEQFASRRDLLLESSGQYIFLSSSRVYADSSRPIVEDSARLLDVCEDKEYLKTREYALKKAREENLLRESGKTNWTIVRPYITYNVNRLQLGVLEKEYWLYRALHGRTIVFHKEIAQHVTTMTHGFDVAKGVSKLIGNPQAMGEAVHIATDETISWNEVLETYLEVIERKTGMRPKVHYLEDSRWLAEIMNNTYQIRYDRSFDRCFNSEKINRLTDEIIDFQPVRIGLKTCLEDFLDSTASNFRLHHWSVEGYMDRITGEHTSLSEIESGKEKATYLLFRYFPPRLSVFCLKKHRESIGDFSA